MIEDFLAYQRQIRLKASQQSYPVERIESLLLYAEELNSKGLPVIYDQKHLSLLTGISYDYLLGVANQQTKFYHCFDLPKRRGGFRTIMEPLPLLKQVQTWILRNILYPVAATIVSPTAKAYMPGIGLKENAKYHRRKAVVVNLDISDFFGSVHFASVLDLFLGLGYNKEVAVLISNLCTVDNGLPQGAPTSPMLSNMICRILDDKIFAYCIGSNPKIMYTRYADDMTFSGNFDPAEIVSFIRVTLKEAGFRLNEKKIKIYRRTQRQTVTNIVVNDNIQLRRDYRRQIRQEIYYLSKYGLAGHLSRLDFRRSGDQYLRHLWGKINYALYINPKDKSLQTYRDILRRFIAR